MYEVKIIEDSTNGTSRLTTFQLKYPRMVHQELLTHRVFSRNASSSRAIPANKEIQAVLECPAEPFEWGKNCPGMQSKELLDISIQEEARSIWLNASKVACEAAQALSSLGVHKQIVNRILEPYSHISVIVTATNYKGFFQLRNHEDADPTIRELARLMQEEYNRSIPVYLTNLDWHLPYVSKEERIKFDHQFLCKLSAARCARVSFRNHDGTNTDNQKDIELAERLLSSRHMSPFEHQAKPGEFGSNNFCAGWTQYRYLIEKNS